MKKSWSLSVIHLVRATAIVLLGCSLQSMAQTGPLVYESEDRQFTYVLHGGLSPDDVLLTTSILEENYGRVLTDLNVESVPTVTVTVWKDSEKYYQAQEKTLGVRYEGSGGYAWWNSQPELRLLHSTWKGAAIGALHEFAHIVSMAQNRSIPNDPRWLWEAIALYATRGIEQPPKVPDFLAERDFPTLEELDVGFNDADERRNIYDVGFFLTEYIVEVWGIEALGELAVSNGNLPSTLNISVPEFEQGWYEFLAQNYLN